MKRDYLSRLSLAARWYLPPEEAAEVIEDYQDIVGREPRSEEELRRDLGGAKAAACQLAQPKAYRRWMAVFLILAAGLLLPAIDMFLSELWGAAWTLFHAGLPLDGLANSSRYAERFFPVGIVLSFVWFQWNGKKGQVFPKKFWLAFPLVLLGMVWVWFLAWMVFEERFEMIQFLFPDRGWLIRLVLGLNLLVAGVTGTAGLILARLEDRRWRAVYVWGLTGAMLSIFLLKFLNSMSFDGFREGWQIPYWTRLAVLTVSGVLGTAVSLC